MAKSREINMNLPSVDDLFTTQKERDQKNQEYVKDISIYEITDFPNHPFKVRMDAKMVENYRERSRTWCITSSTCQREANRWV